MMLLSKANLLLLCFISWAIDDGEKKEAFFFLAHAGVGKQREAAEIFLFINFPRINFTWAQVKYLFRVINGKLKKLFRLTIHSSWASRQWAGAIPEKIGFAPQEADDGSGNRITRVYHWKSSNWTTAFTHKKVSETGRVGGNSIPSSNIHQRDAKSGFPISNLKM